MNNRFDVHDQYGRKVGTVTRRPSTEFSFIMIFLLAILFMVIPFYTAIKMWIKGSNSVGWTMKIVSFLIPIGMIFVYFYGMVPEAQRIGPGDDPLTGAWLIVLYGLTIVAMILAKVYRDF
jgi:hypothetical protein